MPSVGDWKWAPLEKGEDCGLGEAEGVPRVGQARVGARARQAILRPGLWLLALPAGLPGPGSRQRL